MPETTPAALQRLANPRRTTLASVRSHEERRAEQAARREAEDAERRAG